MSDDSSRYWTQARVELRAAGFDPDRAARTRAVVTVASAHTNAHRCNNRAGSIADLVVELPGVDRAEALVRMRAALAETRVEGVSTNLAMHRALLDDPDVVSGEVDTRFLEAWLARRPAPARAS